MCFENMHGDEELIHASLTNTGFHGMDAHH